MDPVPGDSGSCEEFRLTSWKNWALATAAILLMCVCGWGLFRLWDSHYNSAASTEAILKLGVIDHVHCVIDSKIARLTFTPEQMAIAMGAGYVGLVSLLEHTLPRDFRIPVAHRCSVSGRKYVHLVISNQDKILSLIISKKMGEEFPPESPSNGVEVLGIPLHQARMRGLNVVGFETSEHLVFVVSAQEGKDTLQVAEALAVPIFEFLSKLESRLSLVHEERGIRISLGLLWSDLARTTK